MDLVFQSDIALHLPMVLNERKFHLTSLGQKEEWFKLLSLSETFLSCTSESVKVNKHFLHIGKKQLTIYTSS